MMMRGIGQPGAMEKVRGWNSYVMVGTWIHVTAGAYDAWTASGAFLNDDGFPVVRVSRDAEHLTDPLVVLLSSVRVLS